MFEKRHEKHQVPGQVFCRFVTALLYLDIVEFGEFRLDSVGCWTPDELVRGQLLLDARVSPVPTLDHGWAMKLLLPQQNHLDQIPEQVVLGLGPAGQRTLLLHQVGLLQAG